MTDEHYCFVTSSRPLPMEMPPEYNMHRWTSSPQTRWKFDTHKQAAEFALKQYRKSGESSVIRKVV